MKVDEKGENVAFGTAVQLDILWVDEKAVSKVYMKVRLMVEPWAKVMVVPLD